MTYRGVKGTQDVLPPETDVWRHIERTAAEVFASFGFREIRTPVMEYTQVFTRSIGETTDIVEKEMYTFEDKGGRSVTLRPEGTAPVVRSVVQSGLLSTGGVHKLFYMGPMFRYERPQAGRYRQFHQVGAEVFGVEDPKLDAEVLFMLTLLLERLGLGDVECQINSIGCADCRPAYRDAVQVFFRSRLDGLCEDCRRRLETNPLRIMDCKVPRCVEIRADAPSVLDHLDDGCRIHFEALKRHLKTLQVPHTVNPRLVRGLDYYTRTTFEVVASGLGAQNTVVAGGRYDKLVEEFGGPKTPAMGFAMGMERAASLIKDRHAGARRPRLFIAALGAEAETRGLAIAGELRRKGVWVEIGYDGGSLKSQLKRADKLDAEQVLIVGEDELKKGKAPLRDLSTREQVEVELSHLIERFVP